MLIFGSIYYFGYFQQSSRALIISNFPWSKVSSFEISDRGIIGDRSLVISRPDTVALLINLLKKSVEVDFSKTNFRSNAGHCNIDVVYKDGNRNALELTNTDEAGGILRSGNYTFRNDELLREIVTQLRTASQHKKMTNKYE